MHIHEALSDTAESLFSSAGVALADRRVAPLRCDSFVARSAMQKALRRGDLETALRASATLRISASAVIWRRLLVTALEDLGVHQFQTLKIMAAAIERRRLGFGAADEGKLILAVVAQSCGRPRCQAANDLHNLALHDGRYDGFRSACVRLSAADLLRHSASASNDLIERHIAVLSILGSEHAPWMLTRQAIETELIASTLGKELSADTRALYVWAFRKSRLPLALASLLIISANKGIPVRMEAISDPIPSAEWRSGIPLFALDQYTRVGRAALADFIRQSSAWRNFAKTLRLSRTTAFQAAGELLFRFEGAALTERADWDIARVLRNQSRPIGCFIPPEAVSEGTGAIEIDLPLLNELRSKALISAGDSVQ